MNQPDLFASYSLGVARDDLRARLTSGEKFHCPVCDQHCKVYKRKLNSGMAASLCWIVTESNFGLGWAHLNKGAPKFMLQSGGQYGQLRHWGMIQRKTNDRDPAKVDSGLWGPTQLGIAFAQNKVTTPKYIYVYNDELLRMSDEQTNIVEALGTHFNYVELMQPAPLGRG